MFNEKKCENSYSKYPLIQLVNYELHCTRRLAFFVNFFIAVFPRVYDITQALLKSEIDGAFFDSFMITANLHLIRDHPGLRVERTIEHPLMYGMVLAKNSSHMEACARRYVENYPRRVFQRIAHHLKPLKVSYSCFRKSCPTEAREKRTRHSLKALWVAPRIARADAQTSSWLSKIFCLYISSIKTF